MLDHDDRRDDWSARAPTRFTEAQLSALQAQARASLVREAPPWRIWRWQSGWRCVGGAGTKAEAVRLAFERDVVLRTPAEPTEEHRPGVRTQRLSVDRREGGQLDWLT